MALSLYRGNRLPALYVAEPIYLISTGNIENGAKLVFEVLEDDAGILRSLIGKEKYYILDSKTFWVRLESLEPCQSTHPTLSMVAQSLDKKTLRGVFSVIGETTRSQ
jgi:hypothetical protein